MERERERKRKRERGGKEAEALLTEPRAFGSEDGCSVNNVGEASSGKLKLFQFEQERKPFRCTNTTQTSKMSSLSHTTTFNMTISKVFLSTVSW